MLSSPVSNGDNARLHTNPDTLFTISLNPSESYPYYHTYQLCTRVHVHPLSRVQSTSDTHCGNSNKFVFKVQYRVRTYWKVRYTQYMLCGCWINASRWPSFCISAIVFGGTLLENLDTKP